MDWVGSEQLIEVSYRLMEIRSLGGQPENVKSENLWLISGIGNPYSFERMMVQAGYQVGGHSAFPDHHNYTTEDIRTLREQVKNMGVRRVVTTSKDLTKLVKFDELKEILCEAVLGLEWGPQREKMDSDLLRLVR